MYFGEGNIKSKNNDRVLFLTWSLPSRKTCPYATNKCKTKYFARKNENFPNVLSSREKNLEETYGKNFEKNIINYLEKYLNKKKCINKEVIIRIHTSGDFYSLEYFKKWIKVADYFKDNNKILFQAYTKSMPILIKYLNEGNYFEDINIHFVWSAWEDTNYIYTKIAKDLDMQIFTTIPLRKEKEWNDKGYFICRGDCGNCKACYSKKIKKIAIPIH